jgi:hypothetical protein
MEKQRRERRHSPAACLRDFHRGLPMHPSGERQRVRNAPSPSILPALPDDLDGRLLETTHHRKHA